MELGRLTVYRKAEVVFELSSSYCQNFVVEHRLVGKVRGLSSIVVEDHRRVVLNRFSSILQSLKDLSSILSASLS